MLSWGILLLILGSGVYVLRLFNRQFRLLSMFDPQTQSVIGIAAAVAGVILIILSFVMKKKTPAKGQLPPQDKT